MHMVVKGRNMEVPEPLREYVEKKLGRLDRYLDNIGSITVELSLETSKQSGNRHVAQVTIVANGTILRGEEKASDPHSAVDAVADLMHRLIERYKGKQSRRERASAHKGAPSEESGESQQRLPRVVKTKQFAYKPMTLDEAIDQMELLGHDFFVFTDCTTEQANVLYRRRDGDFGLIEPDIA